MVIVTFALKSCGISEDKKTKKDKKDQLPLKSYFYRSKIEFFSNVFYLINGTKEAKVEL